MEVWIFVDGASRGNPGHSGAGGLICNQDRKPLFEIKQYLGKTTNNVAEYQALLLSLKKARTLGASVVHVRSDSELVVKHIKGIYKVKSPHLRPLFIDVLKQLESFDRYDIRHIPREKNSEADRLANLAIDSYLR